MNATRLRTGALEDEDWSRMHSAIRLLARGQGVHRRHARAVARGVARSKAPGSKREHDLGLIVIDYLQLMRCRRNSENRATEISEISRSLKALAKELNVPVIALAANRSLESAPTSAR